MSFPDGDESVSFADHIKPLFREDDRRSMRFAFDLWDYADVVANHQPILERLEAGTMPCDGAWSAANLELFARWMDAGMPA